jgi:hypothetical protein
MDTQNFDGMVVQEAQVHQTIVELFDAMMPDGQYDPADDPRTDEPYARLQGLVGYTTAKGIKTWLNAILVRWFENAVS